MAEEEKFATNYDGPWKDALDFAPEPFLQRFIPALASAIDWNKTYQSLDDELRQLSAQDHEGIRRVDRLLLFETLEEDPLYLHIEVQCRYDRELGRRVMTYRHRLRGRFGKPMVTVIVFGDRNRKWCPKKHKEGQFGSGDACVWIPLKLLTLGEQTPDLENEVNVFSLFIAAHLETLATRKDLPRRQQAKIRLLSNLQRRKLDEFDGREWYRLIDWLMKLPTEMNKQVSEELRRQHTEDAMKYVSFAEREGIEKGIQQGIEKGIQQGIQQGIEMGELQRARKSLELVLEAKFSAEGKALMERLGETADLARLESLTRSAAIAKALDEIRALFEPPAANP